MAIKITPGNEDDRAALAEMVNGLEGRMFGDKGYVSKDLFSHLGAIAACRPVTDDPLHGVTRDFWGEVGENSPVIMKGKTGMGIDGFGRFLWKIHFFCCI